MLLGSDLQTIIGELYEIDNDMLAALDDFEEYPEVYDRENIQAILKDDNVKKQLTIRFCGM